ncbi:MAG: hypothetical protein ACRDYA_04850 [Egibacteraceae bacterium]
MRDEATCTGALEALHRVGVLVPSDLGWLQPALKQAIGAPLGIAIPWAAWATRIGERVRLPIPAGVLAIVVTALNIHGSVASDKSDKSINGYLLAHEHEMPDNVARWFLAARVLDHVTGGRRIPLADRIAPWLLDLGTYPASTPKNTPLEAPFCRVNVPAPGNQRTLCGVREAVVLWTSPALLAGEDLAPWSQFGQAIAEAITLLSDLARLWLDPDARDLRDAALTPLIEAWLSQPPLGTHLLRTYAGERVSAIRHLEIQNLLVSGPYRTHLESVALRTLTAAKHHLPQGASDLHAAAAEFLNELARSFRRFDCLMAFRALLALRSARSTLPGTSARQPSAPGLLLPDDVENDVRMAIAFLSESAPWPDSWEVQRFGIYDFPAQPVGQWCIRGLILRILLDMGHDVHGEVAQLLGEIPPGELRSYGAWRDIPPDADSLGLVLELVAATGAARDCAETWIALLLANTDKDGVATTSFYRYPTGRPTTPSDEPWPGDDCNAVRLQLLCGLLAFDAVRFDGLIQANAAYVLERSGGGAVADIYYYDGSYAALAFLRFARFYRNQAMDRSLWGDVAAVATAIRARMVRSQRLDGGWGSPQHTAFCLQSCAMDAEDWAGDIDALVLECGLRYLSEHQLADGSWPAEPFYVIPLKRGRQGYHQGRSLTTAFCALALQIALMALTKHERPDDPCLEDPNRAQKGSSKQGLI